MRILYYNLALGSYDGSNLHARGMLNALRNRLGEENLIIVGNYHLNSYKHNLERFKKKFSRYLVFPRFARKYLFSIQNSKRIINQITKKEFHPDYILARSVLFDYTPLLLAKKLKCKLIIEHNTPLVYECCELNKTDFKIFVKKYENDILCAADGIYTVSRYLQNMLENNYNIKKKSIVISNGYMRDIFDIETEDINKIRKNIRSKFNPQNKWIVVFIGSLKIWHGIDNLIKAADILQDNKKIEFWVIGDGERRSIIKDYIGKHRNLRWFRNVDIGFMRDLLFGCDIGIMPYHKMEHFYFSPLKMYDMIGAGLPFIGLNIGQINEICLKELNTDFLIDDASGDLLAKKIYEIYINKEKYNNMKNIINQIQLYHSWDERSACLVEWMQTL